MKKLYLVLCGTVMLALASCNNSSDKDAEKLREDSLKLAALSADFEQASSFNDSLMLLMMDVYNGIDSINMQEGLLYNLGSGEHDRRATIRHNLSEIKSRLASNQSLLEQMEKRLKASGNENIVLTKTINQLKSRIQSQEEHIAMLEKKLSVANDSIQNLNQQVAQVQEQVEVQTEAKQAAFNALNETENQLNTVYYAIGTSKELKNYGVLEKKFLGRTKVLQGDVNLDYFIKADKRNLTSIPTVAKKIKILTNMPAGSYEEVKNADKTITLKITDPSQFWLYTDFLVIEVD